MKKIKMLLNKCWKYLKWLWPDEEETEEEWCDRQW